MCQVEPYSYTVSCFQIKQALQTCGWAREQKSVHIDEGVFTITTCFTCYVFFCDTDPQLSFVSKAVIPLTVPYEMWHIAVPRAANCSLYWHLLPLVLLHGSASSMARAVYILAPYTFMNMLQHFCHLPSVEWISSTGRNSSCSLISQDWGQCSLLSLGGAWYILVLLAPKGGNKDVKELSYGMPCWPSFPAIISRGI